MKKASELINQMMDNLLIDNEHKEAVSLFSAWSKVAGINEGAHSQIIEIEKGVVMVKVDHPGWLQKLEFKKNGILKRLKKEYPDLKIQAIRFLL